MSVLARTALLDRLSRKSRKQLVVTPILDETQIGAASIDVRLGHEFLLPSRAAASAHKYEAEGLATLYKQVRKMAGSPLFVHPNQFVLGSTFEFIALPDDLMCYVIGRSSLGRTGLLIATATAVAPGYTGCITLEIVNVGEVPLPLYPGMRIAQLVVHSAEGAGHYEGRFGCQIGPEPPQLYKDAEMLLWMSAGSRGPKT